MTVYSVTVYVEVVLTITFEPYFLSDIWQSLEFNDDFFYFRYPNYFVSAINFTCLNNSSLCLLRLL